MDRTIEIMFNGWTPVGESRQKRGFYYFINLCINSLISNLTQVWLTYYCIIAMFRYWGNDTVYPYIFVDNGEICIWIIYELTKNLLTLINTELFSSKQ